MDTPAAFQVFDYDPRRHPFRAWAEAALGVTDLSRLHEDTAFGPCTLNDRALRAKWNGALTRRMPELQRLLAPFLEEELPRFFDGVPEVRYPPWLRIHPPGWDSISPYHSDSEYGLALGAINVWVPLTRVWDSNALWIESAPGRGDFRPVPLEVGQALLFDAVRLIHGSHRNDTGSTRVSFDFRCHGTLRPEVLAGAAPLPASQPDR